MASLQPKFVQGHLNVMLFRSLSETIDLVSSWMQSSRTQIPFPRLQMSQFKCPVRQLNISLSGIRLQPEHLMFSLNSFMFDIANSSDPVLFRTPSLRFLLALVRVVPAIGNEVCYSKRFVLLYITTSWGFVRYFRSRCRIWLLGAGFTNE